MAAVVINEISWAGTDANAADEWIELYNAGDSDADLAGWTIRDSTGLMFTFKDGAPLPIRAGEYLLVERTDDSTVSDIAGVFGSFSGGGLSNEICERLTLVRADGSVSDEAAPCTSEGKWAAGSKGPEYATAERVSASESGTDPSNWASNDDSVTTGLDAAGSPLRGTPAYRNSVSPVI